MADSQTDCRQPTSGGTARELVTRAVKLVRDKPWENVNVQTVSDEQIASVVLGTIIDLLATDVSSTDRGFIRLDDPETTSYMQGWDDCRETVLRCLG